jgi:serine/threonine protein kinase/tetratricopeptide (TPR) repeat protein
MNLNGRRYGHIRVERILGQGGMGDVYQGFDETLARRVALKVLHHDIRLDAEARTRLIREARTLSQLDHPNICRIYDFIEDGESDVLVLELIDGRTLQQALTDGLSSAEKLRIARDVASVLVAAHRAGIIHRDLKPENVMLTKSGEVKVLDFGLARWLEQKSKSGRNLRRLSSSPKVPRLHVAAPNGHPSGGDPDTTAIMGHAVSQTTPNVSATAYGVTVGTPMFMSPEQARGEDLTPASDMYSFGLMLQVMFTGRDPYPPSLNAQEVMLFAARGHSLPVTGIRRDIAVLIKELKAIAPSDRPTAVDALQRVEHIIGTPKRRLRDAVAAVVVAVLLFGAWKYTTDLQRAEAEARMRRSQANALIGFMLGDLRKKLDAVGKLDILDDIGSKALEYMSSLDPKTLTAEELVRTSKALSQLGEVRTEQGNLAGAAAAFQKAMVLANEAHQRSPIDPANALAVGTAHFWMGKVLLLKGDTTAALQEMKEYRGITEDLARQYPTNAEYQLERAYGHGSVAKALEMSGDLAGSVPEYRVAEGIKQARAAAAPNDTERAADLARTLNSLGSVLEDLGNLTEARSYYEREFAISDSLVRLDAKNADWKARLANSHSYMAALLENLGDSEGALAHRLAALAIYRDLVAHDPANVTWRRNAAVALQHQADLLRIRGRVADALADAEAADAEIAAVLTKDPLRRSWLRDQAIIQTTCARVLHAAGRDDRARAEAETAIAALVKLDQDEPKIKLANAYIVFGDSVLRSDRQVAERAWTSAVALMDAYVSRADPKLGAVYAQAMIRLGRVGDVRRVIDVVHRTGYRQFDFEKSCRPIVEPGS